MELSGLSTHLPGGGKSIPSPHESYYFNEFTDGSAIPGQRSLGPGVHKATILSHV